MNEYQMNETGIIAFLAVFWIFFMVIFLAMNLFFGYCFKQIALKTGHEEDAGLWWIPFINLLIPIRVAEKPSWWLLLFLIPGVGHIVGVIVFMAVAEARGKENWWGIIAVFVQIVGIPYLAFANDDAVIA
jgi:hypothetical protein